MTLKFNPDNTTKKKSAEFQLLKQYERDYHRALELAEILNCRYNDLYHDIKNGKEVPYGISKDFLEQMEALEN